MLVSLKNLIAGWFFFVENLIKIDDFGCTLIYGCTPIWMILMGVSFKARESREKP